MKNIPFMRFHALLAIALVVNFSPVSSVRADKRDEEDEIQEHVRAMHA